ncbi:MAG: GerMN domain-containing protein [Synergistaceae bacterium]|nr:GerMN domain-containing protein [Synergistaceae bacterium]
MKPAARRKWKSNDAPSPREKREMMEREEWTEDEFRDSAKNSKAPILFRLLAWVSLIVIFFAIGYGVTSMIFGWMDRERPNRTPENLVSTSQEAATLASEIKSLDAAATQQSFSTFTLTIPEGKTFVTKPIKCGAILREDAMQQVLSAYFDVVKESNMLDSVAANLNIFQSGDWLYLNVNQSFLESIKILGAEQATYLLTGLVRTMSENFSPVNKVKFYVDGKEVKEKKPVDLSMPWALSGS